MDNPDSGDAALIDLGQAHEMLAASRATLKLVRRRKLPKVDARIIYDRCRVGSELARCLAKLPEYSTRREAFEQAASEMDELREQAQALM